VGSRFFTADEANALLPAVRPLVEAMVEARRRLLVALERRDRLAGSIGGNGGGVKPGEPGLLQAEVEEAAREVAHCIDEIHQLGVVVKDVDRGLVDFPAVRDGEEVLLCWRLGEEEIGYWHGLEEGFAGRKELPL
jgi:hypothetical protein